MKAIYTGNIPYPDPLIGKLKCLWLLSCLCASCQLKQNLVVAARYVVKDVKPTAQGNSHKVKVKVRVNLHGMFSVSGAQLTEKRDATEQEQAEAEQKEAEAKQEAQPKDANDKQEPMDTESADGSELNHKDEPMEEDSEKKDKKKNTKQITKVIELPVESTASGYTQQDLNLHIEEEVSSLTSNACF